MVNPEDYYPPDALRELPWTPVEVEPAGRATPYDNLGPAAYPPVGDSGPEAAAEATRVAEGTRTGLDYDQEAEWQWLLDIERRGLVADFEVGWAIDPRTGDYVEPIPDFRSKV